MLGKKREQTIRVLVASLDHAVPAALVGTYLERTKIEVVEAISTQVAYANLAGCSLAIVDAESLLPSPGVAPEMLARALVQSGIPVVSGAEFATSPGAWLERATAAVGLLDALPPRAASGHLTPRPRSVERAAPQGGPSPTQPINLSTDLTLLVTKGITAVFHRDHFDCGESICGFLAKLLVAERIKT